jgi:hypothetical protein
MVTAGRLSPTRHWLVRQDIPNWPDLTHKPRARRRTASSADRTAMPADPRSFTRCPIARDAKLLQVLFRKARKDCLVYFVLAEYCLALPEAQTPQPHHNVHHRRGILFTVRLLNLNFISVIVSRRELVMSIFGNIMSSIFSHSKAQTAPAAPQQPSSAAATSDKTSGPAPRWPCGGWHKQRENHGAGGASAAFRRSRHQRQDIRSSARWPCGGRHKQRDDCGPHYV